MQYTMNGKTVKFDNIAEIKTLENVYDGTRWKYCELRGMTLFKGITKVTITWECGSWVNVFSDTRVKNDQGTAMKFNSIIDALNYYGNLGWELTEAYPTSVGSGSVYHYLMKKKVESE